jgi:hypothetical protein
MTDAREQLRVQTARNVAGLEHEQRGEWDAAIALYEANVAEGFPGDWPYGRLVLLYTKRGQLTEVVRVLERAVEVFEKLPRSHPERASRLRVFRRRLREARRALPPTGQQGSPPSP